MRMRAGNEENLGTFNRDGYRADDARQSGRFPSFKNFRIDAQDPDYQETYEFVADEMKRGKIGRRADGRRFDAGETAFITRQLLYIKARTFDVKYTMFRARDFLPVSHEVPPGAEQWSFWSWDLVGMAKVIANYATDFESVDVFKTEVITNIKSIGAKYAYTIQDMRKVALTGPQGGGQLDYKRAAAARRVIEARIDDIAAVGLTEAGFTGLINNASVPVMSAPVGNWATATAADMIGDLNAAFSKVITQSNGVEVADTAILPLSEFAIFSQTPYSALVPDMAMYLFLKNNPYCKNIDQWSKLTNQNAGGTGGRNVIYRRDENALTLEIPQEFEQFAPQLEGMQYEIPCHARIGGVVFYYPLSAVYMDGTS
jgi:hypothetical protein